MDTSQLTRWDGVNQNWMKKKVHFGGLIYLLKAENVVIDLHMVLKKETNRVAQKLNIFWMI